MDKLIQLQREHPTCVKRLTPLTMTVSADLRLETFRGDEFSVFDIVALKPNIVLRPMGSTVPEFVPADIHPGALHTFADRPVMLNHPVDSDGQPITALTPATLEASRFGHVFDPRYDEDVGLILPSWLSDDQAGLIEDETTREEAQSVLIDFRAGKSREISVGVWAFIEELEGKSPSGVEYGAIWLDYDGDHLAILETGSIGACDNNAGCGPILTDGESKMNVLKRQELKAQAAIRRLILPVFHGALIKGEFSNNELLDKISGALMQDEDNDSAFFGWITDLYAKQGIVLYKMFESSSHGGADLVQWQRGFKIDKSGIVTLKSDKKKVIGLEPILSDAASGAAIAIDSTTTKGDKTMDVSPEVAALVKAVIGLKASPYTEDHQEFLETQDTEWLKGIVDQYPTDASDCGCEDGDSSTVVTATVDTTNDVVISREEWEATQNSLKEMKPVYDRLTAQTASEVKSLQVAITAAKPNLPKSVYESLELADLLKLHNSLGLAQPTRVSASFELSAQDPADLTGGSDRTEIPDPYAKELEKRAQQRAV